MSNVRYVARLVRSLGWSLPRPGRSTTATLLVLAALSGTAAVKGDRTTEVRIPREVQTLEQRAARVARAFDRVERDYRMNIAPLERVLLQYRSDDTVLVRRVAVSLVREARRAELEPRLLLAVMLVENPWLDPAARSSVGARGLMQVMPLHRGNWKACTPDLDSIESNICHGAQIFASYLRATGGDVDRALLRYNGCVRGTNTPDCRRYPDHVFARAGRASLTFGVPGMTASR